MQQVFQARHPTEAYLAKGILENEGIIAEIRGESLFMARGEGPADMFPTLWVIDEEAERARALLREFNKPQADDAAAAGGSWKCANCGEMLEAQFTTCWNCGAERPA